MTLVPAGLTGRLRPATPGNFPPHLLPGGGVPIRALTTGLDGVPGERWTTPA